MKIVETWADDDYGCRSATRLEINDEVMYELVDGEPEDNSLARNFSFNIEEVLRKAYDAGEAGSGFDYTHKNVSWEEFWNG